MFKTISFCILIFILLSISSCIYNYPAKSSHDLIEKESTQFAKNELTETEALKLVADKYYDGDTNGMQLEVLANNKYLVKLTYDMGTRLISTANAHLVINEQIIASLIDENGATNDSFWQKVDEYRE